MKRISAQDAKQNVREALSGESCMKWIYDLIREQSSAGVSMVAITVPSNITRYVIDELTNHEYTVSERNNFGFANPNVPLTSVEPDDIRHLKIEWR